VRVADVPARAREVAIAYRDLIAGAPHGIGGALSLYAGRAGGCQVAFCSLDADALAAAAPAV
jgi:hypothetical protein